MEARAPSPGGAARLAELLEIQKAKLELLNRQCGPSPSGGSGAAPIEAAGAPAASAAAKGNQIPPHAGVTGMSTMLL